MLREQAEEKTHKFLHGNEQILGKHHLISWGSLGVIIATKDEKWHFCWSDSIIIGSDITHGHIVNQKVSSNEFKCPKCDRVFSKKFALSNHQKHCIIAEYQPEITEPQPEPQPHIPEVSLQASSLNQEE